MDVSERLSLEAVHEPTLIACEHLHRYELAAELLGEARVLDLCCGSGYGSAMLADAGATVHGVDNDAGTIDLARATVGRETGATFEAADAMAVLRRDLSADFDALVCFEGLEHLPDARAAIAELRRHAGAGLRLFVSVPNSRAFEEDNEFHLSDFGWEEVRKAFAGFDDAVALEQVLTEGSLIHARGTADGLDSRLAGVERAEPEWANHYLFAIGFGDVAPLERFQARSQLEVAPAYNGYMRGIEEANRTLARRNEELARGLLGRSDAAAGAYVSALEQRVSALEAELAVAGRDLERSGSELAHLRAGRRSPRAVLRRILGR